VLLDDLDARAARGVSVGRRAALGAAAVAAAGLLVVLAVVGVRVATGPTDHRFTVPAGAGARLAVGEDVDIVPAELDIAAGDSLTVVNQDELPHRIGLFTVAPGETGSWSFTNPGTFVAGCSVHRSGKLTISVR
jgi:plastocyanin